MSAHRISHYDRYAGRGPIPWTREAWLAAARDLEGTRYLMLDDLRKQHPLEGLRRTDVESLLGPLDGFNPFPEEFDACYCLGPEPGFGFDSIWLAFQFDSNDRVVAVETPTD